MTELCVMCGRVLPTESGSIICRTCALTAGCTFMTFNCPDCGRPMEVWSKEIVTHRPASYDSHQYLSVDLIYHCECGNDWDSHYVSDWGDVSQSAPTRHYWG